jgi:serine/threonine protein kinase
MNLSKEPVACDTLVRARVTRPLTDIDADEDEVATPVTTMPSVAGVRPLGGLPSRGPVVGAAAVRESDGLPVTLVLVTASLDSGPRRRIQTESADLEHLLARLPGQAVLPLVDHGLDADGRPFLLAARPGPSLHEALRTEGPLPLGEVLAAAGAAAEGLRLLAGHGLVGPPPEVCRTGGGLALGTPLPPALVELESALGDGTGHEPPEVLGGDDWTPRAQTYACASMLWTLLSGRPAYGGQDRKLARLVGTPPVAFSRTGVPEPVVAVLRSALAAAPGDRPDDPAALAAALVEAARTPTVAPTRPGPTASDPPHHLTLPPTRATPAAPAGTPRSPAAERPAARPLGSRYELVRRIGGGAMGQVWAGRRREDDFPVAVKILRGELSEDPETVDRFLRESRLLQSIRHPNVVEIYDFVKEGDVFGIVMELVDGEDLRHVAARGRLRPAEAAELLAQTASALAAVHAGGVVHRDVKPENILVTERDGRRTAYLSDFGISRGIAGSAHTRLLGTPAYLGPELWAGRPPVPATDVYALGITAYELLTGRLPFEAPSQEAMMRAHLEQSAPRPDGVDDPTWALITACLDRDPANRPDAARVATGWASLADPHVLAGLSIPAVASPPTPPDVPAPRDAATPADALERDPVTGTVISARPLPVRPEPPAPRPRRRLRVPLLTVLAVAVVGTSAGVVVASRHHSSSRPTPSASASPKVNTYPVPASIAMSGAGATLTWGARAGSLPGFTGYVVTDLTPRPVSPVLPRSAGSFAVHDLQAGHKACFLVIALFTVPPPPGPVGQPACITPPRTGGTPTTRPKR